MPNAQDDGWLSAPPDDPVAIRGLYDEWARTYDADLTDWDYRAPTRVAGMLAPVADRGAPVLDAGCGTGMSGRALRAAGFTGAVTGIDVSERSLPIAEASGAYDCVLVADLGERLPFDGDTFGAVACIGVMTYVADVEACWREFCRVTRPGGVVAFTQREDVWIDRGCRAVLDRFAAEGRWTPLEVTDPEPYLPASDELAHIGAHYVLLRVR